MADEIEDIGEEALTADEEALLKDFPELGELGEARRKFLGQAASLGLGAFAVHLLAQEQIFAEINGDANTAVAPLAEENAVAVSMKINGAQKSLSLDSRV